MNRIALFPGSFDPITKGHEDIVLRALDLFDEINIGIGVNQSKNHHFTLEERKSWIETTFREYENVKTVTYSGLTIDFCKEISARYLIRGLRSTADFNFEKEIAQMNKPMSEDIETVFLVCRPEFSAITSTIVRDIVRNGGDISTFIPSVVKL